MEFEFDPRKSEINKTKHGIDFVEAQALWKSKHVLLGAKYALEKRYLAIGTIGDEYWVRDYHLSRSDNSNYQCEKIHSQRDQGI